MSSRLSTTTTLSAPPPLVGGSRITRINRDQGNVRLLPGGGPKPSLCYARAGSATGEFGQVGTVQARQTDYHRLRASAPQRSLTRAGPRRIGAGLHGYYASIQSAIVGGR